MGYHLAFKGSQIGINQRLCSLWNQFIEMSLSAIEFVFSIYKWTEFTIYNFTANVHDAIYSFCPSHPSINVYLFCTVVIYQDVRKFYSRVGVSECASESHNGEGVPVGHKSVTLWVGWVMRMWPWWWRSHDGQNFQLDSPTHLSVGWFTFTGGRAGVG